MNIPVLGLTIAVAATASRIFSWHYEKTYKYLIGLSQLSTSKNDTPGRYFLEGKLKSTEPIHLNLNYAGFNINKKFGILKYTIEEHIQSRHLVEDSDNEDNEDNEDHEDNNKTNKKNKEKKLRSTWTNVSNVIHDSEIQCANNITIDDYDVSKFQKLFYLDEKHQVFCKDLQHMQNTNDLVLHAKYSNVLDLSELQLGEVERKCTGYTHKWSGVIAEGCDEVNNYAWNGCITGWWNCSQFIPDKETIVSQKSYRELWLEYKNYGYYWKNFSHIMFAISIIVSAVEVSM